MKGMPECSKHGSKAKMPEPRVKIPENRHHLYCSMSAFWSKIPSRIKALYERSTSGLIEAVTPKGAGDVKEAGGSSAPD